MRTLFFAAALTASAPAFAVDVLVLATDTTMGTDISGTLSGSGFFGAVDVWNAAFSIPTLAQLQAYDVVVTHYEFSYADVNLLGDTLADFVDAGGGVVTPTFDWAFLGGIGGRFASGGYQVFDNADPYNGGDNRIASNLLGVSGAYVSSAYNTATAVASAGALVELSYDDGTPFVASRLMGNGIVIGVNDYIVSGAHGGGRSDYWDTRFKGADFWSNITHAAAGLGILPAFTPVTSGTCGGATTLSVYYATPGARLAYVTGTLGGNTTVPGGTCAGTPVAIGTPRLRATRTADASGSDTINFAALNPAFCGSGFAVVDLTSCEVTYGVLPQ